MSRHSGRRICSMPMRRMATGVGVAIVLVAVLIAVLAACAGGSSGGGDGGSVTGGGDGDGVTGGGDGGGVTGDASCVDNQAVGVAAGDCDGDGVTNDADDFPLDACAALDTDGDQFPDTVRTPVTDQACDDAAAAALVATLNGKPMAVEKIAGCAIDAFTMCADGDDDDDTVADDSDALPLNACASMDSDGDGHPDILADAGGMLTEGAVICSAAMRTALIGMSVSGTPLQADNCPMAFNPGQEDANRDTMVAITGSGDVCDGDVDDDDDGLIEINFLEDLDYVRYDLDGSHYDSDGSGEETTVNESDGSNMGCGGGSCNGYELMRNLDFAVATGYLSGEVNIEWRPTAGTGVARTIVNPADATSAGWQPLAHDTNSDSGGYQGTTLSAVVEGNGNTIANLYIRRSGEDYVALIGQLASAGVVRNLGLTDVFIEGGDEVGGLIGRNHGMVSASWSSGGVTGSREVGGLVGYNDNGTVSASWNRGSVTGSNRYVGGLVGWNEEGTISAGSWNSGSVAGTSSVGGLIGYNDSGTISASWNRGSVTGSGNFVGGLVGYDDGGTISAGWNSGRVAGGGSIGGLIGYSDFATVSASWSSGSVAGSSSVGGLIGEYDGSQIATSYWNSTTSGRLFGLGSDDDGTGTADDNSVHTDETNQLMDQGLTTAQMRASSGTYPNFSAVASIVEMIDSGLTGDFSAIWDYTAGCYPRLRSFRAGVGSWDGTQATIAATFEAGGVAAGQGDPTTMDGACASTTS